MRLQQIPKSAETFQLAVVDLLDCLALAALLFDTLSGCHVADADVLE